MATNSRRALLIVVALSLSAAAGRLTVTVHASSGVEAMFDPGSLFGSPFPSDVLTVPDASQNTGLRVNLPTADCQGFECVELALINELDGFHVQPRVSIPFNGSLDAVHINSRAVVFVELGDTLAGRGRSTVACGEVAGIIQATWDVATNTLYATADRVLNQHTRYALIVTRALTEPRTNPPVERSAAFERFRHDLNFGQTHDPQLTAYRKQLLDAFECAEAAGIESDDVVVASVFTTQSVTASLEKIREQIQASTPAAVSFDIPPALDSPTTVHAVFELADFNLTDKSAAALALQGWNQIRDPLTGTGDYSPWAVPPLRLPLLATIPGAVAAFAVGRFPSTNYAVDGVIPPFGTKTGVPSPHDPSDVFFTLVIPSGLPPEAGWPVVIVGPGQPGDDMWTTPFNVAASLAAKGLATVSIQSAWHGFGPHSYVTLTKRDGSSATFLAGGRNSDKNGSGIIRDSEGVVPYPLPAQPTVPPLDPPERATKAPDGRYILGSRDAWRQTIADTLQFVRILQTGGLTVDTNNGRQRFDPARLYYVGFSAGTFRGVPFVAVEPTVRAATFHGGGPGEERLSPGNRSFIGTLLSIHEPTSLINAQGAPVVRCLGDPDHQLKVGTPWFNESVPLRGDWPLNDSPLKNEDASAIPIQQWMERKAWLGASADAVAFAPYLQRKPLDGTAGARPVLVLFAQGDQSIPNPAAGELVRAGGFTNTSFFRTDNALSCRPYAFETNQHGFIWRMNTGVRTIVALAAQSQIAEFLKSEGQVVEANVLNQLTAPICTQPPPPLYDVWALFEVGTAPPETLGFFPSDSDQCIQ